MAQKQGCSSALSYMCHPSFDDAALCNLGMLKPPSETAAETSRSLFGASWCQWFSPGQTFSCLTVVVLTSEVRRDVPRTRLLTCVCFTSQRPVAALNRTPSKIRVVKTVTTRINHEHSLWKSHAKAELSASGDGPCHDIFPCVSARIPGG